MNKAASQRPSIKVERTNFQRILGVASFVILVMFWIYLFTEWTSIPDKIPTHFGVLGEVDSWGSKNSVLMLPVIMTALYLLLTILSAFPQYYNYTVTITVENAAAQYKNARTLMLWITLQLVAVFSYITYISIQIGLGNNKGLGIWSLPVFLVGVFGTVIYYIRRMVKLK
ncbi:MAG: DUF1648 domain-containing protein [Clostridiaceae bacterium]|nr:DUF1648 domain-containing protein [Clostridiaceae bacterium]